MKANLHRGTGGMRKAGPLVQLQDGVYQVKTMSLESLNDKKHVCMLAELLADDSDTMSEWEVDFIESLNRQRNKT